MAYSTAMSFLKKWYDKVSRKKQFTTLYRRGEEIYGNGYVLFEMGNYEEALDKYNEAAAIWGELENKLSELEDDMEDDLAVLRKNARMFFIAVVLSFTRWESMKRLLK